MTLTHIHLKKCSSTQEYAKNVFKSEKYLLVSCDTQQAGFGTRNKAWDTDSNALAFTCLLKPHQIESLTSLELGVLICLYFKKTYKIDLKLKWPNDILTVDGKKCAGILISAVEKEAYLAGIGINILLSTESAPSEHYRTPKGFLFTSSEQIPPNHKKKMPAQIYHFINENRFSKSEEIISNWNLQCAHRGKPVSIIDDTVKTEGIFMGVGLHGQALISTNDKLKEVYTGSLYFNLP